jgi:hypothetical protein
LLRRIRAIRSQASGVYGVAESGETHEHLSVNNIKWLRFADYAEHTELRDDPKAGPNPRSVAGVMSGDYVA